MANYTKTTNFTAKDSLPFGNAAKKILGSLFDTEFNNISTAIASKANLAGATFTGSTTLAQLTLDSGASVTAILDEDDMASDSATAVTTQQSTKAFVLATVTDIGALLVTGTPAANDFAKFTSAAEIVGRSYAETRADLSLEVGTDVQAYDADTAKLDAVQTYTATQTWTKGADVASATELPLVTDGNYFDVTGTATATSFASLAVGTVFKLHFDGAMILTNNTDIVCLSAANVLTEAGDEAEFVFFEAGKVRMTSYSRLSGSGLAPLGSILLSTTTVSGVSSIDVTDNIDSTYDEYVIDVLHAVPVTNNQSLHFLTIPSGTTPDTGGSDYIYSGTQSFITSPSGYGSNGAAFIELNKTGGVNNTAAMGGTSLTISLKNPSGTTHNTTIDWVGDHPLSASTNSAVCSGTGKRMSTAAVIGFSLKFASGNVSTATVKVYGKRKTL